jgi:hypothetical protein
VDAGAGSAFPFWELAQVLPIGLSRWGHPPAARRPWPDPPRPAPGPSLGEGKPSLLINNALEAGLAP